MRDLRARVLVAQSAAKMLLPLDDSGLHRLLFVEGARDQCRLDVPRPAARAAAQLAVRADRAITGARARSSSRGTPVLRPNGQTSRPTRSSPVFGACQQARLRARDGLHRRRAATSSASRCPAATPRAISFGMVLLNDWSARDLQAWEYMPLGPFNSKTFATSISPWIVTMEALEPFRTSSRCRIARAAGVPADDGPARVRHPARGLAQAAGRSPGRRRSAIPISSTCTGPWPSSWRITPCPAATSASAT